MVRYQGSGQRGGSDEVPWVTCCELFKLDDACRTEERPTFGDGSNPSHMTSRLVIHLEEEEARRHSTQPGWFFSPLPGDAAVTRLTEFLAR